MRKPLKTQHNQPCNHVIEKHAARALGMPSTPTPRPHPGPRARRATPPGGPAPQVCLPLLPTPCMVSGPIRFQDKTRCWGTRNGVGGCVSPALMKIADRGVRV
jgi:hypothetical protein